MPSPYPRNRNYSFENDDSGRLFCWLIESGAVDVDGLINRAMEKQGEGQEKVVKRLAKALEKAMETHPYWVSQVPTTGTAEGYEPHSGRRSPGYAVWFRPDPSEKIRFKEIAAALLRFTGRGPQEDGN